ncbi:MAG TPA: cytochrome c oxidase subunit 3 [Candidatus Dormibacteraeota bacterium]
MAVAEVTRSDVPRHPGLHTGMMGMFIFLSSEVMFFGSLFAMYFYMTGSHVNWPPIGTRGVPAFPLPTVNTVVLLSSGVTMHIGHMAIQRGRRDQLILWLIITILLGAAFEAGQAYEFLTAHISFTTNHFASAFFTMTGFHGGHVMGGLIFLCLILGRTLAGQFDAQHHIGVAACAIYWHFVDAVWVFLYLVLYWGATGATGQ